MNRVEGEWFGDPAWRYLSIFIKNLLIHPPRMANVSVKNL